MNNLTVLRHNITCGVLLIMTSVLFAQTKRTESFNVNNDVLVSVNTSFTNVVFETWNKNSVEVEAYVDGEKLSQKEKEELFKDWKFDILGNSKKIVVTSNVGNNWKNYSYNMDFVMPHDALKALEGIHEMPVMKNLQNMHLDIKVPKVPKLEKLPKWPFGNQEPSVISGDGSFNYNFNSNTSINFDSNKYKKNKQAYVNELNKKYNSNATVGQVDKWLEEVEAWSKNVEEVMGKWGENFGKEFDMKFGPEFEKEMEQWGEEFGKRMEQWGEEYGKKMEQWSEEHEKNAEKWSNEFEKNFNVYYNDGNESGKSKVNRTIIIRMPKGTKTEVDVRHGELKMADAYNMKATLNYSTLTANSIDGGKTLINASYAPVIVNNWQDGALYLKFVNDCTINNVKNIQLNANSSDVVLNSIQNSANLTGSFGNLFINAVSNDFTNINIVLENTDVSIKLPTTAFSFSYNGKKSTLQYPRSLQLNTSKDNGKVMVKGFNKSNTGSKAVTINAAYSNVKMQ
ncbi:hypothetical protein ATE92_0286 [Ulvibacter sp. MAR_2010_11]|uniref:hypothetical protein n=1 Tax=Ulvibacter sp. MAR_2010_11 TaxID=1250229 RepID=UPI000CB7C380|nr:hypothetical protein [Ulvibacter sp. MAR_2010_11]PKA82161.1 hypothetical protein ATE92_0286 [Ulvibacter sp. MAR_2010_11]